jgi:hypothetical protein
MYREARKLERKGFSGAAQQVATAAAQQKLADERPGFLSADTAIEEQKLRMQAGKQGAALASGMRPQDSRRGLFEDIRAAAGGGIAGAEGEKQLAGFRSRATQLGVTSEAFDRTVGGKLGVALPAVTAGVAATTTTAVAKPPLGPLQGPALPTPSTGKPERATKVLRPMRNPTGTPTREEATGATGGLGDFMRGVGALTTPEGGDLTRGAAVDELNRQRTAAGQVALPREEVLQGLLAQDRTRETSANEPARISRRSQLESNLAQEGMARFLAEQKAKLPTTGPAATPAPTPAAPAAATTPTPTPTPAPAPTPAARVYTTPIPKEQQPRLTRYVGSPIADQRARNVAANEARDKRIAERIRNIAVPDWQKDTVLGRINRRFQEISARAQQ